MKSTLRILQVEDSSADAKLILAILEDDGIVCESKRVETEVDFCNALSAQDFDLILSDRSLPGFDGFSALKIFLDLSAFKKGPRAPFIFVSGAMGEETAIESLKSGATDYVLKDRLSRLCPVVRRAIKETEEQSARKLAEKKRLQVESMFRGLFNHVAAGVVIAGLDGRIIETNGALQAMFGYGAAELCGMRLSFLTYPEDASADLSAHEELCAGKRRSYQIEKRYVRRDGTVLWGRVNVSKLQTDDDSPSSLIHLIEDITGQKQQQQQLLQAQKMEVVGRLAAGVSHDFNNLLTVINGYSQQLLGRLPEQDLARRELEAIHGAGERGAILIQRLLAFSRQQVPQSVALDLNSVITNLEPLLLRILRENITLKMMLDPAVGCIEADQTEIEQVILNLVINARDAMPKGGELMIGTGNSRVDGPLADSRGLAPGDYVDLEVTDTGHGMDEETKSRIFESFFTTKEVGQGTGLGLWMAHEITERSRGAITVKSAIGRGTSFRLCLPRAARGAKAEFARVTPHTSQASAGGTETIMVVDDEAGIRELVSDILKSAGYRVLLVRDGAEALAAAEREVSPIHLLITDVAMPGVGGRDLSASLAASRPGIKVLYISGYSDSVIAGERAAGYLQKPFRSEALLQRVRDLLDAPPEVTILIVDDDPSVRGFLGDILRPIGYLVVEAANGNQTLHQLRQRKVDLVISDLIMPDQDGLQTIPIVREEFPDVRVLAISGGFGEQFLPVAQILGAHATLPKPFKADTIKEMVRRLLRRDPEPDQTCPGTIAELEDSSTPALTTSGPAVAHVTLNGDVPRPTPPTADKLGKKPRSHK